MRRVLYIIFVVCITIIVFYFNINLHTESYDRKERIDDVVLQLNFLEEQLKEKNAWVEMQQLFPEGFVFINALYGLAWCELAMAESDNSAFKERAVSEALYAYRMIDSDYGKIVFDQNLSLEYGVFYRGWENYLLSKILSVDTSFNGARFFIETYKDNCNDIISSLKYSETPYLESYFKKAWPADMFVAMASICAHDRLFEPIYENDINLWLQKVEQKLDTATNLFPHSVNYYNGKQTEGARGCSNALILRMLAEIDNGKAQEYYRYFDDTFITTTLGLPSVREYPHGIDGEGDVDSGPVIFGVGFSGTIVTAGIGAIVGDSVISEEQYKTINAFGFPETTEKYKKYLWGNLPMADAFIAWGRATELHYSKQNNYYSSSLWTAPFHLYSLGVLLFLWAVVYRKRIFCLVAKR